MGFLSASFLVTVRERFVSWLGGIDEARREILLASLVLVLLLLVGTVGYVLIEGEQWTWIDGLYMTFITLTTIGFAEVQTLSTAGRLFTIGIAFVGIGAVAFVAARSAQLLINSESLRQRQIMRRIRNMEHHYIIAGYGRIGKRVVEDLQRARQTFVVIDRDPVEIKALQEAGLSCIQGDSEDEETLRAAGIDRARGLIITLPEDATNVFVTLVARELNPTLFILARTNDARNRRKLLQAGARKVIAPSDVGADRMAQVVLRPHVDRFMEQVLKNSSLGLQIDEVEVQPRAALAGKTLAQSNLRQQFDAIVIAIIDAETGEMKFNPGSHDEITAGDVLIVLGSEEMISRLRRDGCMAP